MFLQWQPVDFNRILAYITNSYKVLWRCKQMCIYRHFHVAHFLRLFTSESLSQFTLVLLNHSTSPSSVITFLVFGDLCHDVHRAKVGKDELAPWFTLNVLLVFEEVICSCHDNMPSEYSEVVCWFLQTAGLNGSGSSIIDPKNNQTFH